MRQILMRGIRWYQQRISVATPAHCRYWPTCSTYTLEAIDRFGALKGSLMGTARILRCQPLVKGGFDPVPDHFSLRRNPVSEEDK